MLLLLFISRALSAKQLKDDEGTTEKDTTGGTTEKDTTDENIIFSRKICEDSKLLEQYPDYAVMCKVYEISDDQTTINSTVDTLLILTILSIVLSAAYPGYIIYKRIKKYKESKQQADNTTSPSLEIQQI